MLAKYAVTVTFSMMFAYMAELYPTLLRNTAVGICSTVGRLGNCIAPFLVTLSESIWVQTTIRTVLNGGVRPVSSHLTPPLLFLSDIYLRHLPYIVMGTLAFGAATSVLFLPESFGKPLPETIHQMQKRERWAGPLQLESQSSSFVVSFH